VYFFFFERFVSSQFVSSISIDPDVSSVIPKTVQPVDIMSEVTDTASELDRSRDLNQDLNSSCELFAGSQASTSSSIPSVTEISLYPESLDPRVDYSKGVNSYSQLSHTI